MYYNDDWSMTHDGTDHSLCGLLFDSGAALNVCPKHYAEEIPIQPLPDRCNLRIANGQRLQIYGLRTVGYEFTDRQRRVHLYVDFRGTTS